jgi:two-component system, chemotaxis family, sensor kinase CheA
MPTQSESEQPSGVATKLLEQTALDCVLGGEGALAAEKARTNLTALAAALEGTPWRSEVLLALETLGEPGSAGEQAALARLGERLDLLRLELARSPSIALTTSQAAPARVSPPASAAPPARSPSAGVAPQGPIAPAVTERDSEMVELFGDFVAESLEGLDRAEPILLAAEHGATDIEQVNALFRVFHTIKGVSGFLSVAEVTRLAHVTEALLEQVRQGKLELAREALDVVFESSATMRRTLELLRTTVPQGLPDPTDPTLPALVARIERATAGAGPASEPENHWIRPKSRRPSTTPTTKELHSLRPYARASRIPLSDGEAEAPVEPRRSLRARAPQAADGAPARLRDTVKVDLERVDSIVEMVGELIIVESMVVNAPELAHLSNSKLRNYLSQMTKISRDLQNASMRMRMVPVSGVFRKMARLVRDLSRKTGKQVEFVQVGEATEMDRSMVERIEDPLVHMMRNALDHAIEPPEERRTLGKATTATIQLSASHEGGSVAISLKDDGRGLSREKILKKARERALIPGSGETLTDQEVYALIFAPGFSTASQVTEISGRGVGMDVVKRSVEDMRGRVLVDSKLGVGTTFKLILPLTLAIIDGMLVASGDERYIIPSLSIVESLQPAADMVHVAGDGTEIIAVRGEILPLLRLGTLFAVQSPRRLAEQSLCVILESAGRKLGLLVDDILTQQQVVIKPLGEGLGNVELLAGAAILPDGRVGLIINVERLSGLSGRRRRAGNDAGEVAA